MNYYISRLLLDLSEIAAALGPTKIALYFKAGVTNTAFKGASEGNLQRRLAGSLGVRGQIIAVMYVQAEDHEQ